MGLPGLVETDPNRVALAQPFDVSGFGFDEAGLGIGPPVVDPSVSLALGDLDGIARRVDAVLIAEVKQALADQFLARRMGLDRAVVVEDVDVEVTVLEWPRLRRD